MPLHLLGKKSWNVYNQANIDRVREDEEKAAKASKVAEQEQISDDSVARLRQLRDDTEAVSEREADRSSISRVSKFKNDNSRPGDRTIDFDSMSNMRFKDAAGRSEAARQPWYVQTSAKEPTSLEQAQPTAVGQQRSQARMDSGDPLMAMKRGVKQLREVERQRQDWRAERERDLEEVEDIARRERHRHKREASGDERGHRHRIRKKHREERNNHRYRSRHRSKDRSRSPRRESRRE